MELKREDLYGIIATIVVHILLLLLLIFFFLSVQAPDPPLPPGMEIDFGMSVEGSGNNNMAMPTGPVVSNNPMPVTQPTQAAPEELKTSEVGEEISNYKPNPKPSRETQPVEKPKPVINQGALLPGKKNDGGQGTTTMPGNQGRQDGNPNGGGGEGGTGTSPRGSNRGISIKLDGRSALSLPKPRYTEQEDGTVVVKITVDRNGNVINATTTGVRGSTTSNANLQAEAIAAAKKAKFNVKADAPPEQIGYITYIFERG